MVYYRQHMNREEVSHMSKLSKKSITVIIIVAVIAAIIAFFAIFGKSLTSKTLTAEKLDDFRNVCYGNKIANAGAYTNPQSAVVAVFYERPFSDDNPWTSSSVGNASYSDFAKTNVVACFDHDAFAGKELARCEDDIKLMSATYKAHFYNAKTGEKIADGNDIVTDNATCPSTFVYSKLGRETARTPDSAALQSVVEQFTK